MHLLRYLLLPGSTLCGSDGRSSYSTRDGKQWKKSTPRRGVGRLDLEIASDRVGPLGGIDTRVQTPIGSLDSGRPQEACARSADAQLPLARGDLLQRPTKGSRHKKTVASRGDAEMAAHPKDSSPSIELVSLSQRLTKSCGWMIDTHGKVPS